jgi:hypothetical protein
LKTAPTNRKRSRHSSKRIELTERGRELSNLIWITIVGIMDKRWYISTQAISATIPSMGTNRKPLMRTTWEEVKPTRNDV